MLPGSEWLVLENTRRIAKVFELRPSFVYQHLEWQFWEGVSEQHASRNFLSNRKRHLLP